MVAEGNHETDWPGRRPVGANDRWADTATDSGNTGGPALQGPLGEALVLPSTLWLQPHCLEPLLGIAAHLLIPPTVFPHVMRCLAVPQLN